MCKRQTYEGKATQNQISAGRGGEKKWIGPRRKRRKSLNPSPVTTPAVSFIHGMRDADEDVNGGAAAPTHPAGVGALFNV